MQGLLKILKSHIKLKVFRIFPLLFFSWVCNQTVLHADAHQDILNDQAQDVQTKPDKKQR